MDRYAVGFVNKREKVNKKERLDSDNENVKDIIPKMAIKFEFEIDTNPPAYAIFKKYRTSEIL